MRITQSAVILTLVTLISSGCFEGSGSGLMGICCGDNGGGSTPPVLGFFVQPNSANVGQIITPAVEVVVRDSLGSTDSSFTGSITIGFASNPTGANLSGATVVQPVNGIATFSNLAIDKAGTYTLQAGASGAEAATSGAFSVIAATGP
jgi:hypothetical protein